MHILARNESLICGCQKFKIRSIVIELLKIYPAAAYAVYDNGYIVFAEAIHEWITNCKSSNKALVPRQNFLRSFSNIWDSTSDMNLPSILIRVTEIVKWSFQMLSMILERLKKSHQLKGNKRYNQLDGNANAADIIDSISNKNSFTY